MVQATTRCVERYDGIDAVDLFCGGGLTCGSRQSGVDVRMDVDSDGRFRYACEHDNEVKFLRKSVTDFTVREMRTTRHVPHRKISEADVKAFNAQYPKLAVRYTESFHDRFLVVDDRTLYLIGASLKDLGRKCFAFTKLDASEIYRIKRTAFAAETMARK